MEKASTLWCAIAAFAVASCGIAAGGSPHKSGYSTNLVEVSTTLTSSTHQTHPKTSLIDADATPSRQDGGQPTHEPTVDVIFKAGPPVVNLTTDCSNIETCLLDAPCTQCFNVLMAASGVVPTAGQPISVLSRWASRNISEYMSTNVCDLNSTSAALLTAAVGDLENPRKRCGNGPGFDQCGAYLNQCHGISRCRHCVGDLYSGRILHNTTLTSSNCSSNTTMPVLQGIRGCDGFPACTFHKVNCSQSSTCRGCANLLEAGQGTVAAEHCSTGLNSVMLDNVVNSCMARTVTACDYAEQRCRADPVCGECFNAIQSAPLMGDLTGSGQLTSICTQLNESSQRLLDQITDLCPRVGPKQCTYAVASCAVSPDCVRCYNNDSSTTRTQCKNLLDQKAVLSMCHKCDDSITKNNAYVITTAVVGGISTAVCGYFVRTMIAAGFHRKTPRPRIILLLVGSNFLFSVMNAIPANLLNDTPGECGQFTHSFELIRVARALWFGSTGLLVAVEVYIVWAIHQGIVSKFKPGAIYERLYNIVCISIGLVFFVSFYVQAEAINRDGYNEATQQAAMNEAVNHAAWNNDQDDDGLKPLQTAQTSFSNGRQEYDHLEQTMMRVVCGCLGGLLLCAITATTSCCHHRRNRDRPQGRSPIGIDEGDENGQASIYNDLRVLASCVVVFLLSAIPILIMADEACTRNAGGRAWTVEIDVNDKNISQSYSHVQIGLCYVRCELALSFRSILTILALWKLSSKEFRRQLIAARVPCRKPIPPASRPQDTELLVQGVHTEGFVEGEDEREDDGDVSREVEELAQGLDQEEEDTEAEGEAQAEAEFGGEDEGEDAEDEVQDVGLAEGLVQEEDEGEEEVEGEVQVEGEAEEDDESEGVAKVEVKVKGEEEKLIEEEEEVHVERQVGAEVGAEDGVIDENSIHLEEKIGQGSSGVVCKGQLNGKCVAVKYFGEEVTLDERPHVAQFKRECINLKRLNHEQLLKFYGYGITSEHRGFIVTDLFRGSLRDLLANTSIRLDCPAKVDISLQIAEGMRALHKAGLIHRDLKSQNIFINSQNRFVIGDFGSTRAVFCQIVQSASVSQTTALGSSPDRLTDEVHNSRVFNGIDGDPDNVGWRAPEIFDARACDMASDVYAFGIVMFEVVTRLLPWVAELEEWKSRDHQSRGIGLASVPKSDFDFVKLSVQAGRRPPLPAHHAPEQFRQIIKRCWAPILPGVWTTRPLFDSANEFETISDQIRRAWEDIKTQFSITLEVHLDTTSARIAVPPHATHKEIKDKILNIAGLKGRPIDTVALFKAQDHEERVCCSYNGLLRIVDDKYCAAAVLRAELSPEVRAKERGDASRLWKSEDGENPICISPPGGLFQQNAQSGRNNKDPESMKVFLGATVCGTWQITEYLSKGGFGRGWACVNQATGQREFLKTFRTAKDRGVDPIRHEKALQRELEALLHPRFREATRHDSIAKLVLLYGEAELKDNDTRVDGLYCVVSPDLASGDLHHFLCPGERVWSFSPNATRFLFRMIGDGVAHLHKNAVYHRDLKPSNIIIVEERFQAKIIDFGSAKFGKTADDKVLTKTTDMIGTDGLQSPEFMKYRRCSDPSMNQATRISVANANLSPSINGYNPMKYDVWSCGITLFYMVTAESIWKKHGKECFKFIQNGGTSLLSNDTTPCTAGLWDAVSELQEIDPAFQECVDMLLDVNAERRARMTDVLKSPYLIEKPDLTGYLSEMKTRLDEIQGYRAQKDEAHARNGTQGASKNDARDVALPAPVNPRELAREIDFEFPEVDTFLLDTHGNLTVGIHPYSK